MSIQRLISLPAVMKNHFHKLENRDPKQWFCDSDPGGTKVGSGGGTSWILYMAYQSAGYKGTFREWLDTQKRMVIHSGGQNHKAEGYRLTHPTASHCFPCLYFDGRRVSTWISDCSIFSPPIMRSCWNALQTSM